MSESDDLNRCSIEKFREYIRINTAHPDPSYEKSTQFLLTYGSELGIPVQTLEFVEGKPLVLFTIEGENPELGAVLLNSHVDVVSADLENWHYDPFGAHMDEQGNIYGRGTQDMKSVGIQYLEAIKRIRRDRPGNKLLRTIYVLFVPDEEIGGKDGMFAFTQSEFFKTLRISVALDEGIANPSNTISVCYGERAPWWVTVICKGPTGHGSRFIQNTAVEKLMRVINTILEYRREQEILLLNPPDGCCRSLGDVVSINLTKLEAGNLFNVIPSIAKAGFDIRIPVNVDLKEFKAKLDEWTAGEDISYEFAYYIAENKCTTVNETNQWWNILLSTCEQYGLEVKKEIFPVATDSRFLRGLDIPAFGFSPMPNTPVLLHDNDEFLNASVFLKGIETMQTLITSFANLDDPNK